MNKKKPIFFVGDIINIRDTVSDVFTDEAYCENSSCDEEEMYLKAEAMNYEWEVVSVKYKKYSDPYDDRYFYLVRATKETKEIDSKRLAKYLYRHNNVIDEFDMYPEDYPIVRPGMGRLFSLGEK